MNYGFIYCLSNDSLSNIYKIGFTNTIDKTSEDRAKELSNTSIPTPYKVLFDIKVNNPHKYEKIIHDKLIDFRINLKREFFKCSIDNILLYFKKENIITNEDDNNDFPDNYFNNYFDNNINIDTINDISSNFKVQDHLYELNNEINNKHLKIFNYTILNNPIPCYFVSSFKLMYPNKFIYCNKQLYYFYNNQWLQDNNNFSFLKKFIDTDFFDNLELCIYYLINEATSNNDKFMKKQLKRVHIRICEILLRNDSFIKYILPEITNDKLNIDSYNFTNILQNESNFNLPLVKLNVDIDLQNKIYNLLSNYPKLSLTI
jgi:hypothetical protein